MSGLRKVWQRGRKSSPDPEPRQYTNLFLPESQIQQYQTHGSQENEKTGRLQRTEQYQEEQRSAKLEAAIKLLEEDLRALEYSCDENYETSPNVLRNLLKAHLDDMKQIWRLVENPADLSIHDRVVQCHVTSYEELGMYEDIEQYFSDLFPLLKLEKGILTGLDDSLQECVPMDSSRPLRPGRVYVTWLVTYVRFLARTGRRLDFADALTKTLPWLLEFAPKVKFTTLSSTVRILNQKSQFLEAANQITIWYNLFPMAKTPECSPMHLQVAINKVGFTLVAHMTEQERMDSAQRAFILAFVSSSIVNGPWHPATLEVLYYFGKALREWNLYEAAGILQEECYLGYVYRLGVAHPCSTQALAELQRCKLSRSRLHELHLFGQSSYDREKKLSIAYEHIHLNTAINLLQRIVGTVKISYVDLKYIAEWHSLSGRFQSNAVDRAERIAAECILQLGDAQAARKILVDKIKQSTDWKSLALRVEIINSSGDSVKSSKSILQFCEEIEFIRGHQQEAVYRRLTTAGHMHFTREVIAEKPALISEDDSEAVGTGAFAVVDSIKIGSKLYARKSLMMPRYHQKAIRKIIQNEVSIVRALEHPHIIRVFLTYEDKFRFYIVMQPLADCDLEAYLQEHAQKPPTQDQRDMVWKWMLCLSNTMAYIHFKGIRHKDIKPRNVLVKGTDVVFADFGSGHVFLDEGNSTTEGPSFGHTKIYCAPEVLTSGKRGRMSDIFSLGCVFTELAVWLAGSTLETWNQQRKVDLNGVSNNMYSATLMQVTRMMGLTQNDREVCGLYEWVIKPMLREEPKERPTAVQVSERVISSYQHVYGKPEGLEQCPKCRLEQWVDVANAGSASVLSFDTGTSTLEEED